MARIVKPLTATQVQNAKPKDKPYKIFDGGGLFLQVSPSGGKRWKMKYVQASGKESLLSFGPYPEVSLEQARRKRDEARSQKAAGKDPGQIKRQEKAEQLASSKNSFGTLATEWLELARSKVSPKTMYIYEGIMRRNLLPALGDKHIREIRPEVLRERYDLIEHQLAHMVRDPNGRAYNRTEFIEERRGMMSRWADYLDSLREKAKEVQTSH